MSTDAQQAKEYFARGHRLYEAGDLAGACRDLARGTVHAQRSGQATPADVLRQLARAYCLLGKFEQARASARQGGGDETILVALDWIQGAATRAPGAENGLAALTLGFGAALAGRFEAALGYLKRVRREKPAGSPFLPFNAHGWIGVIALRTGHLDRAATYLGRSLELAADHPGLTTHRPIFQAARAELVLASGNVTAAVRLAEAALDLAERTQQPLAQALCQHTLTRIVPAAPNPDWDAAAEMIRETMLYFQREKAVPLLAVSRLQLGLLHAARGETTAARALLAESGRHFAHLGMGVYQKQAAEAVADLEAGPVTGGA